MLCQLVEIFIVCTLVFADFTLRKNFLLQKQVETQLNFPENKKSAESDVAPAGIKSYKFLFELKKIYFAVFKKLIG